MSDATQNSGWWLWSKNPIALMLWPLSLLFCLLVFIRRKLYQWRWLKSEKLSVPVLVVGNISVGGNGKTPVVQSLQQILMQKGYKTGILTRGYKSDHEHKTVLLEHAEISDKAGDEANMLSELCGCPIAVGADRIKTAKALLQNNPEIDLVIADDGLQHYALRRDIEIIVQRQRAYGNGFCLPAGPLREPLSRLQQSDLVIDREGPEIDEKFGRCWNLKQPDRSCDLSEFSGQKVMAIAGIGFPELFFDALKACGLTVESQAFADHHTFSKKDIEPYRNRPLLITHKDAVKIRHFASDNIWVVPLVLKLSDDLQYQLFKLLETKTDG